MDVGVGGAGAAPVGGVGEDGLWVLRAAAGVPAAAAGEGGVVVGSVSVSVVMSGKGGAG